MKNSLHLPFPPPLEKAQEILIFERMLTVESRNPFSLCFLRAFRLVGLGRAGEEKLLVKNESKQKLMMRKKRASEGP